MAGRFERADTGKVSFAITSDVIVDKETGVNYLFVQSGYAGGLTPLLDRDGKPVVTPVRSSYDPER